MFRCLSVILLSFFSHYIYAGADSTSWIHLTLNEGLPSNHIYSAMQDHNGFIWIATDNGVVKFDGYNFRVFNTNDGLPTNDAWEFYEDSYGRIWLYCYAQQIGYIKNNIYRKVNFTFPDVTKPTNITQMGNLVFFGLSYHVGTSYLVAIDSNDNATSLPLPYKIAPPYSIHSSTIMYSAGVKCYYLLSYKSGKLTHTMLCKTPTRSEAYNHTITFGDTKGELFLSDKGSTKYDIIDLYNCKFDSLSLAELGCDKDERLVLTNIKGDTAILITTKKIIRFSTPDRKLCDSWNYSNLFNNAGDVVHRLIDNHKNIWISTSNGAYLYAKNKMQLNKTPLIKSSLLAFCGKLSNGDITWYDYGNKTVITQSPNGHLTFKKSPDNLLSCADNGNGITLNAYQRNLFIDNRNKNIHDLISSRYHFIISDYKRIDYLDLADEPELMSPLGIRLPDTLRPIIYKRLIKMQFIDDNIFIAVTPREYILSDIRDSVIIVKEILNTKLTGLAYDTVNKVAWAYNSNKIYGYDIPNKKLTTYNENLMHSIGIGQITSVATDRFGNIYILSGTKLVACDNKFKNIVTLSTNINLNDVKINTNKNNLVLSGKFGIGYIPIIGALQFGKIRVIPNTPFPAYNKVNDIVFTNSDTTILLNTDKGLFDYSMSELLNTSQTISPTQLFKVVVHNANTEQALQHNDTISCPSGSKKITLDAINFYGAGNRKYVYRIGNDKWQQTLSGEIIITDLKPNVYYTVTCSVYDDLWESNQNTFVIYVQPMWYQTTLWTRIFWILGILAAIVLVLLTVIITKYYVNKANAKRGKLLDLELRAIHSQINPHFIFNSLSSALYFINRKKTDEAYEHISKFSKLLRSYLKSSQERYTILAEEIDMLKNYIELQQTRFESKFDYNIEVENKIPANSIKIPSLLLQPLVENAINHGLFHKQGKGHLSIKFTQGTTNDELICTIEDDGVGRARAQEIKEQSDAQYNSYGTKLTQKLIDIFKEYEYMNIFLEYIDKAEPKTGTIVKLTLKNLKYAT
ncbi:MAG: histidine kinase [Bacteroidetes bacterium]|nr:histidine kinase [Bacteroidota bacterium]